MVYLDDSADQPLEPVLEALGRAAALGRIKVFGVRNWAPGRIRAAIAHAARSGQPGISAVVTTELSMATAAYPLWPEYLPFDEAARQAVQQGGLGVLAHVGDFNLGQCLFGDEDAQARGRPEWVRRWQVATNEALVRRVQGYAEALGFTAREVNVAYVLSQPFPVVGIVGLPSLLTPQWTEFERASATPLSLADCAMLGGIGLGF